MRAWNASPPTDEEEKEEKQNIPRYNVWFPVLASSFVTPVYLLYIRDVIGPFPYIFGIVVCICLADFFTPATERNIRDRCLNILLLVVLFVVFLLIALSLLPALPKPPS